MTRVLEQAIVLGTVTGFTGHCAGARDMPIHFPLIAADRIKVKTRKVNGA